MSLVQIKFGKGATRVERAPRGPQRTVFGSRGSARGHDPRPHVLRGPLRAIHRPRARACRHWEASSVVEWGGQSLAMRNI
ncbi:hypothetical protein BC826DRAFT_1073588 [Russula brevipes]|nr:hypothetical protein BC826DRAFT_1073588 [Russula brevipes]